MPGRPGGLFSRLLARLSAIRRTRDALSNLGVVAGVALAAAVVTLSLNGAPPFRAVENFTYDWRVAHIAPPPQDEFVIIKMDDAAIKAMSDASPCHCISPINKVWLAGLIAELDSRGVKAIAVDYLLDTWAPGGQEFQEFSKRIAGVKAPVIAVVDPAYKPGVDFPVDPKLRYADARDLISDDYDDVIRRYDPLPGKTRALSAEVAAAVGATPPTKPFAIRYRRPYPGAAGESAGAIAPSYSAAVVPFLSPALFKGKIAFIGAVTRSTHADPETLKEDMDATPMRFVEGNRDGMPGVEVHVHALSQMLAGDSIIIASPLVVSLIVLAAGFGGAWLGQGAVRWWVAIAVVAGGLILTAAASFLAFYEFAFVAPMVAPVVGFAFAFFVMSRLTAAELSSQRAFYSSTLERYLAPQVIDRIVEGREAVKIGAEAREITVMVSDLEDFSTLVAGLPLDAFQEVINGYFDGLIEILWKHEAMIDKMIGDGLIVIFGAPVAFPDHASRALACARDIDVFAEAYRKTMLEKHGVFGQTRMGLDSGIGLVGNFGGERRFNYTAYGEVMVVAARLEAANKTFGTRILLSGETHRLAGGAGGETRAVGEIDLKGIPIPIEAYTVV
ncbi:CHASE2 domain-containing protein [Phenylobacterium sp.]|uniref:CHASE2 domain-containing protein n=1 Tax=Phenylobacterium sp. TaxID=1871053 RepID=UPI0011FA6607|nr:CHASE2 domain-containing protein [Phenylobacterium sp.]THD61353.1 MAG: CHASE2 domain-containing protein [Phenylobacterium sp.]